VSGARRALSELVPEVFSELDLDVLLERVLGAARELSGARYAALGVLDESKTELTRFLTLGIDDAVRAEIGPLPRGHGVLGELIRNPTPLRLDDVGSHPRSYGFPSGHPPMHSFLGVPIMVRGEVFGNLYLSEKAGGFDDDDEDAAVRLAELAGIAIDNARRFTGADERRGELEGAVAALQTTTDIARALSGHTDLAAILELAAKRTRAVVSARTLAIGLARANQLTIAATAGERAGELVGRCMPLGDNIAAAALRSGRPERAGGDLHRVRFAQDGLAGLALQSQAALYVPLMLRGQAVGALIALDRVTDGPGFSPEDEMLLEACAVSVTTAVAAAQSFSAARRSARLAAAEDERRRWARELHDETLQSLASLKLGLEAARMAGRLEAFEHAVDQVTTQLDIDIDNLRALITDLRPAALDEIGTEAALSSLCERAQTRYGLEVSLRVELAHEQGRATTRHHPDLETAIYRIVQEGLTNAHKHASADRVTVDVLENETTVNLRIRDDGDGFDPSAQADGFGLTGIRERVELLAGTLDIQSALSEGTIVTVTIPAHRRAEAGSTGEQPDLPSPASQPDPNAALVEAATAQSRTARHESGNGAKAPIVRAPAARVDDSVRTRRAR
jgi:signal transduction histidine kinase